MARRSQMVSPWHNCTRCGVKTHLDEMHKERGILVCSRTSCTDTELIGARDARLVQAVVNAANLTEMQPHPVLTDVPVDDESIFF